MKKRFILAAFGLVNLLGVTSIARAQNFDYDWAYDPLTHKAILVCVNCWFWSCDCGSSQT